MTFLYGEFEKEEEGERKDFNLCNANLFMRELEDLDKPDKSQLGAQTRREIHKQLNKHLLTKDKFIHNQVQAKLRLKMK